MAKFRTEGGVQIPLTAQEEADYLQRTADWESNVAPVLQRRKAFLTSIKAALANLDVEEIDILVAAYDEVKRYRIDSNADTPIIDGMMTVFQGQTKPQIGLRIESRVQTYLVNAGIALAEKIRDE